MTKDKLTEQVLRDWEQQVKEAFLVVNENNMIKTKYSAWDPTNQLWIYIGYTLDEIASNGYELDGMNIEWFEYTGQEDNKN